MEALIAALIGWIETPDELLNIQTGLRVRNVSDDTGSKAEVTFPNGEVWEYLDEAADAIFDRAEQLARAGTALNHQLNVMTAGIDPGPGATT